MPKQKLNQIKKDLTRKPNTIIKFSLLGITLAGFAVSGYAIGSNETLDTYVCEKDQIIFDDGDWFSCGKEPLRALGFDTPETFHPKHGIYQDQPYGKEATALTNKYLEEANIITIIRYKTDPYDRTLSHILLDGELLAVKMIKAGLAYENISHYKAQGFPEFALQILDAAAASPEPMFENPPEWREKHQHNLAECFEYYKNIIYHHWFP